MSQVEIAKELGVSQALVSMVLNGRKNGIAAETVKRIWEYAVASGYSPKGMKVDAFSQGKEATSVGYFLRSPLRLATKSNFFSHVSQGLHDYLSEHDLNLVFLGAEGDFGDRMKSRVRGQLSSLKGIVILGEIGEDLGNFIEDLEIPTVIISARSQGLFNSVNSNEQRSAALLVDHLLELGHKRFAFLGANAPRGRFEDRRDAFVRALRRRGIEVEPKYLQPENTEGADRAEGVLAAERLLLEPVENMPTAWIVVNGSMARGICAGLMQHGKVVGRDVSVAAIDMTRLCTEETPTLTSSAAIPEELGREAGRLLVEPEGGQDILQDIIVPVQLVARESTGPAPQ